ncbi:MAG TPA: carboxypeptidase regulatory-like domain-containing protein [Gemmatimonadota bacterium]|nr:carboxypeptidase regulatory-like domain-containing protein [Gemmatimonadota bacterium]
MMLALAIVAGLGFAVQDAPGTVQGFVRDAGSGEGIAGAEVVLVGSGRSTVTDQDGRYVITDIPGGERRIGARRLGFAPLEAHLSVPSSGVVSVDFHLRVEAFQLAPVGATVAAVERRPVARVVVHDTDHLPAGVALRELDTSPGVAELGISAGARALLGPDPPAPDNVLYVRGAGASLDLVLLDGAPVQAPFHLGGLVSPGLPPSIVRADRLQGGVSARYDGGLSDVLLLDSRPGAEGVDASVFVDMLAAGGTFESADEGVGAVFASYRNLHGSWEDGLLQSGFPQRYADALLRGDLYPSGGSDTLSVTIFQNEESVRIGDGPADEAPRWGNTAGSVRYRTGTQFGRLELGGALGSFDARLPVGAVEPLVATGKTQRARAWADFENHLGATRIGYGVQGERLKLRTQFRESRGADTEVRLRQRADAGSAAVWVEGRREVLPDVDVAAGMRANLFTDDLGRSLSPRLNAGWQVSDDLRLSGSYGRFHQLVVTVDTDLPLENTIVTAADGRVLGSVLSRVAAARSTHLVFGVTHAPKRRSVIRIEAFWKSSVGVPEFGNGSLRNAGIDVLASRPIAPGFTAWGAYTLGWAWADYPDAATQTVYAGRHFLRGGVTLDVPGEIRLDADLSMGQGLEFGAVPRSERAALTPGDESGASGGEADASTATAAGVAPLPGRILSSQGPLDAGGPIFTRAPEGSYLRLNVQATAEIDVRFLGRDQRLLPYFRIVNALDRRDALFFHYDSDVSDEPRAIGSVPILPVVGLEWRL